MDQGRLPAFWRLLWELTWVEFKLREQGTVLGFIWTLLYPLLMFIVLYCLFVRLSVYRRLRYFRSTFTTAEKSSSPRPSLTPCSYSE